jgi:MerR family mercuric resistance operon transcriptional regulator
LKLVDGGRDTCAQVKRITVHHLDDVRQKVADLQKIERVLREMAAQCDGGRVPKCAVIDALFELTGRFGVTLRGRWQSPPGLGWS